MQCTKDTKRGSGERRRRGGWYIGTGMTMAGWHRVGSRFTEISVTVHSHAIILYIIRVPTCSCSMRENILCAHRNRYYLCSTTGKLPVADIRLLNYHLRRRHRCHHHQLLHHLLRKVCTLAVTCSYGTCPYNIVLYNNSAY